MKKVLVILSLMLTFVLSAQTPFVSVGVSISEGNFVQNSYPSFEGGVSFTNVSVSGAFGRGSLDGTFSKSDHISNYWYEAKVSPYLTVQKFTGTVFMGAGQYIGTNHFFTDMGIGVSYAVGNFNYGVAYNRWDEVNYVRPSITYNFN